ncbi:MAG: hypothetical protein DRJ62_07590, partial [Thermoprotei archaeon]
TNASRVQLVKSALEAFKDIVDASLYDVVVVVHAGGDEVLSGSPLDISSFAFHDLEVEVEGRRLCVNVAVVSELDTLGVYCHELMASLGLPELYDPSRRCPRMGSWCLMDEGFLAGSPPGSSPPHISSWCKLRMGWLGDGDVVTAKAWEAVRVYLMPIEYGVGVRAVKVPVDEESYYLIEARVKWGFDQQLPSEGVLVVSVNESSRSPLTLVDFNPSTPTLDDACLTEGSRWVSPDGQVEVEVLSRQGDVFLVEVLWRPSTVILESYELTPPRASPGHPQRLAMVFKWPSGEPASNVTIRALGFETLTNSSGVAVVSATLSDVGTLEVPVEAISPMGEKLLVSYLNGVPVMVWDLIVVKGVRSSACRVDVGSQVELEVEAEYALSGEPFTGDCGALYINGLEASWDEESCAWRLTVAESSACNVTFRVSKVLDLKYGVEEFEDYGRSVSVVWDKVVVELRQPTVRFPPGSNASISYRAYYESTGEPFVGLVELNDSTVKSSIGKYYYTVERVVDELYGLTAYESNTIVVIFDEIDVEAYVTATPLTPSVRVVVKYISDGSPASGAHVEINGLEAVEVEPGVYEVAAPCFTPTVSFKATVELDGFTKALEGSLVAYGNVVLYAVISCAALIAVWRLRVRFKARG